jgi:hypothetical protein
MSEPDDFADRMRAMFRKWDIESELRRADAAYEDFVERQDWLADVTRRYVRHCERRLRR